MSEELLDGLLTYKYKQSKLIYCLGSISQILPTIHGIASLVQCFLFEVLPIDVVVCGTTGLLL